MALSSSLRLKYLMLMISGQLTCDIYSMAAIMKWAVYNSSFLIENVLADSRLLSQMHAGVDATSLFFAKATYLS